MGIGPNPQSPIPNPPIKIYLYIKNYLFNRFLIPILKNLAKNKLSNY